MSKYPATNEHKVDLGPVYAVNPRYLVAAIIHGAGDIFYVEVIGHGWDQTSELESRKWCEDKLAEITRANPSVLVSRDIVV